MPHEHSLAFLVKDIAVITSYSIHYTKLYEGETWTQGEYSSLDGPGSRFFIRRLQSGRLLLINHKTIIKEYKGKLAKMRSHLCAWLSYDEGKNWIGELLLDERENVSYPDGVESKDGSIYIIHDRDRYGESYNFV